MKSNVFNTTFYQRVLRLMATIRFILFIAFRDVYYTLQKFAGYS